MADAARTDRTRHRMKDALVLGGLLLAFALLMTMHMAIVFGLAQRSPRWRALAALFVPPLAPYWALRGGMMVRASVWIGSLVLYATFLGIAAA